MYTRGKVYSIYGRIVFEHPGGIPRWGVSPNTLQGGGGSRSSGGGGSSNNAL